METRRTASELVRCVACRRLYDLALTTTGTKAEACCPACGATGRLAARVPIDQSTASRRQ